MSTREDGKELIAAAVALQQWLSNLHMAHAIVGGLAVGLVAAARYTKDVDGLIYLEDDLPNNILQPNAEGIVPRITDAISFAEQNRVLLLRHEATGIEIDLALGILSFELEVVERALSIVVGKHTLRVAAPEDLIIMKALANRPADWGDVDSILRQNPQLDKQRIRDWCAALFELLPNPVAEQRLEELLNNYS